MHAAGALRGRAQGGLDRDMKLGRGAALAHLVDMDAARRHAHHTRAPGAWPSASRQHDVGAGEVGHADGDRTEAADLMLRRHGALVPGMGLALPAIVDED